MELAASCAARDATRKAEKPPPDRLGDERAADVKPE
jgi:hypothetical protein